MTIPSRWNTAPSATTAASVRLVTLTTTYLPRMSVEPMATPSSDGSFDACVQHLDQLLLLECAGHLGPQPLDQHRAVALERLADHAARSGHVDANVVEDAAGPGGEHDHAIGEVHRFVDVVGDEDHGLARAVPDIEQERLHL